jgi:hypothetical protein
MPSLQTTTKEKPVIITPEDRAADQVRRLETKTQDQQLRNLAVEGAGISKWEAEVLVDVVKDVYFNEPGKGPLRSGQTCFECVAIGEGAGKPIRECRMASVVLTLFDLRGDRVECPDLSAQGLRRHRIQRLTEEARDQGGLLSQEDLALLLCSDVRTIRRDIRQLREGSGIFVATRGQIKDIGPGVSHKGVAIRLWLEGLEPVEVARRINHTLKATERYIHTFCRIVYLRRKAFHEYQIALTVGISTGSVTSYLEIYEGHRAKPEFQRRFEEIDFIGASHFETEDEKKGVLSQPPATSSKPWGQP